MRVRANLVASARRHLPCLAFACTRMRGDTIVWPELTQIGVNKSAQNQLRFAMNLVSPKKFKNGQALPPGSGERIVRGRVHDSAHRKAHLHCSQNGGRHGLECL
jgi:hypothetical protein